MKNVQERKYFIIRTVFYPNIRYFDYEIPYDVLPDDIVLIGSYWIYPTFNYYY